MTCNSKKTAVGEKSSSLRPRVLSRPLLSLGRVGQHRPFGAGPASGVIRPKGAVRPQLRGDPPAAHPGKARLSHSPAACLLLPLCHLLRIGCSRNEQQETNVFMVIFFLF